MTKTTTNAAAPARRPGQLGRRLSYVTRQQEILLGHAELTAIMDMVLDAWNVAEYSNETALKFEALLEHLDELSSYTGNAEPSSCLR